MRVADLRDDLLAALLPGACVHCGDVALDAQWQPMLCGACAQKIRCWRGPAAGDVGAVTHAGWIFAGPIRSLLHALKYDGNVSVGLRLGRLLPSLASVPPGIDLVPMPLHWRRRWRRGHNQAAVLAAGVADAGGQRVCRALRRVRATRPQVGLAADVRERNVSDAFRVPRRALPLVRNRSVALVDDVLTTGATGRAARAALLAAGARDVRILVAAIALRNEP